MKAIIIFTFSLFFIISCDTSTYTTVNVVNSSSYDLHIKFTESERFSPGDRMGQYNDIELKKGGAFSFRLNRFGPSEYRRPNEEIIEIVFLNLNTGEVIKIIDSKELIFELFKLENSRSDWQGELSADYLLEITDDLLH